MKRVVWAAALLMAGFFGAFMALVPLFSDGPQSKLHGEYLVAYAIIIGTYGLISWAGVRFGPWGAWTLAWAGSPGVLLLVTYMEPPLVLRALVAAALLLGLGIGWVVGRPQHS